MIGFGLHGHEGRASHFVSNVAPRACRLQHHRECHRSGFFITNIGGGKAHNPETQVKVAAAVTMPRWIFKDREEWALFLASPASGYLTSQQIIIRRRLGPRWRVD